MVVTRMNILRSSASDLLVHHTVDYRCSFLACLALPSVVAPTNSPADSPADGPADSPADNGCRVSGLGLVLSPTLQHCSDLGLRQDFRGDVVAGMCILPSTRYKVQETIR